MTEITENTHKLPAAIERFVLHWGEMGQSWGVNRSVAQVQALLFTSNKPLSADDISEQLGLARSNVSTSVRELLGWGLVKRVQVLKDRRDFFVAEADMLEMVARIARGRKAREIDPTLQMLRACSAEAGDDPNVSKDVRKRLNGMLKFMEATDKAFDEILRLPPSTLMALLRAGGAIARFVNPKTENDRDM